jgi:uroporphyrinogen decarboxylase
LPINPRLKTPSFNASTNLNKNFATQCLCHFATIKEKMIKNDLFLRALNNETVTRPPVWMMRQAGRYLPEFIALRDKYDFFTRCQTPELAAEITVQPIRRIAPDAAILFSDILVVPQAMGIEVLMKENIGPFLPNPIRTAQDVEKVIVPDIHETLGYVMDAIKLTKEMLNDEVPLIGFAGSPWTIFCYAVEGKGSKSFDMAKGFCFSNPVAAHVLLQKITDTTILYLKEKVKAGVNAVQIFDSWGGMLSPVDYQEFSWKYINQIVEALAEDTKVIVFGKGCWFALGEMSKSKASALGVDWTCSPRNARYLSGGKITLQGNFDPSRLLSPIPTIKKMVHEMIDEFGKDNYIVNLGHGILPNIPVDHAKAFIDAVKEYQK